jgi:hypothetical protein
MVKGSTPIHEWIDLNQNSFTNARAASVLLRKTRRYVVFAQPFSSRQVD